MAAIERPDSTTAPPEHRPVTPAGQSGESTALVHDGPLNVRQPSPVAVSVIVPTYQEAANVDELVRRIASALEYAYPAYEVILVDDDSGDGIEHIVRQLQSERFPVRLLVRTEERGLSTAVLHGFRAATGDVLVCMDADLSHPPEKLPGLVEALADDQADFVIGSRYVPGGSTDNEWGWFRWLNSRIATLLARPFSTARDPLAGFFAIGRDQYDQAASLDPVGYKIGLEILVKADCRRVVEVPISFADRQRGESKLTFSEQLRYLQHLVRLGQWKYGARVQFVEFCLVGSTGMVVDLLSYMLLLTVLPGLALPRALSIWLALSWNWWLNRRTTFARTPKRRARGSYWRFACSCSVGALISWTTAIALPGFLLTFATHPLWAAGIGIMAGTFINFQLSRHWVFGRSTDASSI